MGDPRRVAWPHGAARGDGGPGGPPRSAADRQPRRVLVGSPPDRATTTPRVASPSVVTTTTVTVPATTTTVPARRIAWHRHSAHPARRPRTARTSRDLAGSDSDHDDDARGNHHHHGRRVLRPRRPHADPGLHEPAAPDVGPLRVHRDGSHADLGRVVGDTYLTMEVTCPNGDQNVGGTSAMAASLPDASGSCLATVSEPATESTALTYTITIGPAGG